MERSAGSLTESSGWSPAPAKSVLTSAELAPQTRASQKLFHLIHRQTHNICQRPGVTGHNEVGFLLNRIPPRLVEGVDAAQVQLDGRLIQRFDCHFAGHSLIELQAIAEPAHGHARKYGMRAPAQPAEHRPGVRGITGYVEHRTI